MADGTRGMRYDREFAEGEPRSIREVVLALRESIRMMPHFIRLDRAACTDLVAAVDEVCTDLSRGVAAVVERLREARDRLGWDAHFDSDEVAYLLAWLDARLDEELQAFRVSRRLREVSRAYLDRPPETFAKRPGVPKRRYEVVDSVHPAARSARAAMVAGHQIRLRQLLTRLERDQLLLYQEIDMRLAEFRARREGGDGGVAPLIDDLVSRFELIGATVKSTQAWVRGTLGREMGDAG